MAEAYDPQKPSVHVEFFVDAVQNAAQSKKEGRPIFEDKEFVRVKLVGDNKNTLVAPAHSACGRDRDTNLPVTYAERFPEHYRYFKDNGGIHIDGTPLSEVPFVSAAKREELKHFNVLTVEALAGLDGSNLARLGMGGRELKNRAQAWLDAAAGTADSGRLAAELAARDDMIADLQRQITEMRQAGLAPTVGVGAVMNVTTAAAAAPAPDDSPFEAWDDGDIKNWLKDQGEPARGNPGHKTLVGLADDLNARLRTAQAQAQQAA